MKLNIAMALAMFAGSASAFRSAMPQAARGFRSSTALRAVGDKIPAVAMDFGESARPC